LVEKLAALWVAEKEKQLVAAKVVRMDLMVAHLADWMVTK
jgi:hypothetical protein